MSQLPFPIELPSFDLRPGAHVPVRIGVRMSTARDALGSLDTDDTLCDAASQILPIIDQLTAPDVRVKAWMLHPDERVPIALVTGPAARWLADDPGLSALLYARGLADACRERVLWTPLLDRLATSPLWPRTVTTVRLGTLAHTVDPVRPSQILAPLRGWIEMQDSSDALLPLCSFRAGAMLALVGIHAPVVDRRLFLHLANETAVTAGALARNRALSPDQVGQLGGIGLAWLAPSGRRTPVGRAILAGLLARPRPDSEQPAVLAPLVALARAAATVPAPAPLDSTTESALSLALGSPALDGDALAPLCAAVAGRPEWMVAVVTHPAASPATWVAALTTTPDPEVRIAIRAIEAAQQDVTVRALAMHADAAHGVITAEWPAPTALAAVSRGR
jgi:hypothetical protein